MRSVLTMLLLMIVCSVIDAEYIRSIRVGSYPTQESAQSALEELKDFAAGHEHLESLQRSHQFMYRYRSSGEYYITLVEPFYSREVLQEVLDTLRLQYKDIYVTKLSNEYVQKYSAPPKPLKIVPQPFLEAQAKPFEEINDTNTADVEPLAIENVHTQTLPEPHQDSSKVWLLVALLFTGVSFLLVLWSYLRLKRKQEFDDNKIMILDERFQKMEQLCQNKEQLISYVSHELRVPLTSIMGLTHLALEDKEFSTQNDYLFKIEESAQHLLNIINNILDVSKIEAGALQIENIEFNLNDVLEYVLNIIAIEVKKNGNGLFLEIEKDVPPKLLGDPFRLGQVIVNIASNAVKFTKNGEIHICVERSSSFEKNVTLKFTIRDSGIGMSEQQSKDIFTSYRQAEPSISRKYGGTGLGLSISKQLIEMMRGSIQVQSQKDKGTTFSFTIPFGLKESNERRYYRVATKEMLEKKVLLVSQDEKKRLSIANQFQYFHYAVYQIPSFEEAEITEEVVYDLVCIDAESLNATAIEKITKMRKAYGSKVVVVTQRIVHKEHLEHNFEPDEYLHFPFTQQSLLTLITKLFAKNLPIKNTQKSIYKEQLQKIGRKKVLVAEDNALNHKVIKGLLSNTNLELSFVHNGEEALAVIEKEMFDLILMDINMPVLNGYETARKIRKIQRYATTPILALSADVLEDTLVKVLESGMQGHIAKPMVVNLFYKKILDILETKTLQHQKSDLKLFEQDPGFSELSISSGIANYNQRTALYRSALENFKLMHMSTTEKLSKLCIEGDYRSARELARVIKDEALEIGAFHLCEAAAAIEYDLEKGIRSNWKKILLHFDATFNNLLTEIEKYLKIPN